MPACAKAGPSVSLPAGLPSGLPLPPGTVITTAETLSGGVVRIRGTIPSDIKKTLAFFQHSLPAAGYELGVGDAEADEAESEFMGNGYGGGWVVRTIPDCPGALSLILAVGPAP